MVRSALLLLMAMAAGGCVSPQMRVVDYHSGRPASTAKAPLTRMYSLYAEPHERVVSTTIVAGEPIGFVRVNGVLQAVAGNDRMPIPDGNYVWLLEFGPEPPPAADVAVGSVIVAAVILPVVVVAAMCGYPFDRLPPQQQRGLQSLRSPF